MAHQCDDCGQEFEILGQLRLHERVGSHDEMTVLDDGSVGEGMSHREIVQELLPGLKGAISEQEYNVDFYIDLQKAISIR